MYSSTDKMTFVGYCDGASRGNPGQASAAWAAYCNGELSHWGKQYLGPETRTNNYAEYYGLILLLEWAIKFNVYEMTIYCDSELIVNQVNEKWQVHNEDLKPLQSKAAGLLIRGRHKLFHVKGHAGNDGNEFVDRLCNRVLDEQEKQNEILRS
jgi:probable phosphoglycerate mutase